MREDNYYVYYNREGCWIFDRTMPKEVYANKRVQELKKIYDDAKWTKNEVLKGAFY